MAVYKLPKQVICFVYFQNRKLTISHQKKRKIQKTNPVLPFRVLEKSNVGVHNTNAVFQCRLLTCCAYRNSWICGSTVSVLKN